MRRRPCAAARAAWACTPMRASASSAASIPPCRSALSSAQALCCWRSQAGKAGPGALRSSRASISRSAPPVTAAPHAACAAPGYDVRSEQVAAALSCAGDESRAKSPGGWQVTPPAHRFDIAIEADLIEEVARMVGFEAIPERAGAVTQHFRRAPRRSSRRKRTVLDAHERARLLRSRSPTHSSIRQLQQRLFPERAGARARESDRQRPRR